jgi:uncharacterized protein (TIGR00106 family)
MVLPVNSFYDGGHRHQTAAPSGEFGMQATAELQVVPIGAGVSVRREIMRVVEILNGYAFTIETHASGTNIEGDLDDILAAVQNIHVALHAEGTVRLVSYLKLETRTDKPPTLAGKRL